MGNDDKVKELSLFLSEELEPLRRSKKVRVYDLETEYAKTRNNRLWNVWIALGLTFVFVILVTICTVRGIGKSAERIDVNLSSFEDLNLQNLFNQLERAQENFEEASKRRASLQGTLDARIERAKQKMQADLDLLKRTSLSKTALAARREKIQSDYNKEVSAAHAEIDEQLKTADAEAKQYEEQLKSYDSENVARAQEWERKMDSERQARQLERQKLVDDYEAQLAQAKNLLEETRKKDFEERKNATNEIAKRYEEELASFDPVIKDIRIMQGMPMVVLLMIMFYIVFARTSISGVWVAVIGFGMNFGAYVSEMIRTGILAVDKGQMEAALALGYTKPRAFMKIVLPQAARHFLPVFQGEFISLVKMTSVVGYIAIQDLTKAGDIIRSRTYEAFFPLIAIAIVYFVIAWLLTRVLVALQNRFDPKRRRK